MCKQVKIFGHCNDGDMATSDLNYYLIKVEDKCKKCEDEGIEQVEDSVGFNMITWEDEDDIEDAVLICPCGMVYKRVDGQKINLGTFR